MYCKKCKFHSFDHVKTCPKCGADWEEARKSLYLNWITSSGYNWLSAAKAASQTVSAPGLLSAAGQSMHEGFIGTSLSDDVLDLSSPQASAQGTSAENLDASLFPDLDFTMPEPAPTIQGRAQTNNEAFRPEMSAEHVVELDITPSFGEQVVQPPVQSKPNRTDLFIPELEEMLAPLEDELPPAGTSRKADSMGDDIILDFSRDDVQDRSDKG